MTLWVVKGGRGGIREARFLTRSVIGIGWGEVGDLSQYPDRDALRDAYRGSHPERPEGHVNTQAAQLWAFGHRMQIGDPVVVPFLSGGMITGIVRNGLLALAVIALWVVGSLVMQWTAAQSATDSQRSTSPESTGAPDDAESSDATPAKRGAVDLDLGVQLSAHHDRRTEYADQVMTHLQDAGAGWVRART